MDAAHAVGPAGLHRHLDDGQGRGVRREHRAFAADAVELAEEVLLRREVFHDRLEYEVALGQVVEIGDRAHSPGDRVPLGRFEAASLDLTGERSVETGQHRVGARP